MMTRMLICLVSVLAIVLSGSSHLEAAPKAQKDDKGLELFKSKIEPVLVKHCYECHSRKGESVEGGLELDSPAGMMRGGDTGPMLKPHDLEHSSLIQMLKHEGDASGMPPEQKLSDDVIAAFEEWIRLGCPDSRKETGPTLKEQRYQAAQKHWAFVSPQSVKPPAVKQTNWPRNPVIDGFVLSAMEQQGLKPVQDANRLTLVRRVYFDLVGLPPTPAEVDAFLNDKSPDALAKLVDKLLASPRFGERWGRHWLDVIRFAESSGMEFNFTYPHAWPYRNYVIDAFNQDKPYNIFLQEQIAGDLIPAQPNESPETIEARKIAPSMLSFGPKRHNSSGTEFRMDIVDDQINTVCRATMALTVSCARCHDHKFDPIPTADYYSLAGIFLSTEPLYGTIKQKYSNTPTDLLPIGKNAPALHAAAEAYDKQLQETEKQLTAQTDALKKAKDALKLAAAEHKKYEQLVATTVVDPAKPNAGNQPSQADVDQKQAKLNKANDLVSNLTSEVATLKTKVAELKKNAPARPHYAMSARDRKKPADTYIAVRGDFREKGDVVPRGFLSAIKIENTPPIAANHSGRLELAQWITSEQNPITARVMVNRIWHHLFGRGLVPSVDNFGVIGKQPTHPELLDALALQFVQEDWSTKQMIRTIMLSRAYQLSSTPDPANMEIDPDNRLLWRASPRRLEAEAIRDAILTVSGQLDFNRPTTSTVTPLGDKLARSIPMEKLQPPSNHRSVYLPVVRDYVPELFDLFDFPSPSLVSGNRAVTNVPAQALYLRNSQFITDQSRHAAQRLLADQQAKDDVSKVKLAMRWALARTPTAEEQSGALQLIQQVRQSTDPKKKSAEVDAWAAWFQTLYMTAEFRFLVDAQ
ncbi:Planctomycete cytochrome C [Gimesia alba]|uniref:Planctomycete cytochrome C n=1 Tax=Gimesia alba TaxID=2527973 RepID=A0A517RC32_9PLAN|nr:PSD1 and planctomycete cytochrome C domain-containing protein [Gimesia alba]QDT41449.1 Planctomycete cytochrome C [Gimesia alba]